MGLVLIVDTNSSVRETLQHSLHRRGYGIISAGGMEEALQKARQHKPDVILLDVMMNYCAGFNILSTLVSEPATAALPVIALSMDADTTGEKLTLGAICCSAIPVDFSPLIDALNEQKLISNQAVSVLVVSFGTVNDIHAAHAGAMLAMADLHAEVVKGSGEAIMAIVSNVPDAIVIFADTLQQADVHSFLSAVKSENDFARIPVLLATNSNVGEEVFFHIGGANPHFKTAVDYIAEQVSAVLRLNSYRHVIPNSGDEGPESGILNDN
jgi:CheY-like chemotaxis protein